MATQKFQFRMAALLRIRESTRDERRVKLADSQRTDAELQNQLAGVETERLRLLGQCRLDASPGEIELARLVDAQRYAAALQTRKNDLNEQRRTLAEEIDRRRQSLIEADREVRTLEKLRENQLQNYKLEQGRQDGKRLDEAAIRNAEIVKTS